MYRTLILYLFSLVVGLSSLIERVGSNETVPDNGSGLFREDEFPSTALAKAPTDAEILKFLSKDLWPESLNSHPDLLAEIFRAGPLMDLNGYGKAMKILAAIVEFDSAAASDNNQMRTAVAVALEFAGRYIDKGPADGVARYQWYRDAQAKGRLHPSFDELNSWERRFVVNLPWHHGGGTNDELEWLNLNVKLPPMQYRDACWQAPYHGDNPFGETVQGPLYYVPFEDLLKPYEMRREIGAVCGGLSHYGAAAARANGIGATTMGEPGHCAYAIRVDGVWYPAYSLSVQRSAHQSIFHSQWPYVVLQEAALKVPDTSLKSMRLLGAALMMAESNPQNGARLAIKACEAQPLNPLLWEQRLKLLQAARLETPEEWWKQGRQLGEALRGYPSVAVHTLSKLDDKKGLMKDPLFRAKLMAAALQKALGEGSPQATETDWESLFNDAYKFVGPDDKLHQDLFKAISGELLLGADCHHFFQDSLVRFQNEPSLIQKLVESAEKGFSKSRSSSAESRAKIAEAGMASTGKSRDPKAFQIFAKLHPDPYKAKLPAPKSPFKGKLLSDKGSIQFSSTSHWDNRAGHGNVLSVQGGAFHTGDADDEWVEVTLPMVGKIEGLIIDNAGGNHGRAVPMSIQVSVDGEMWSEVRKIEQAQGQWIIDLSSAPPVARMIRIHGSVGRKDFLHFQRILVYGKPQS